MFRRRHRHTPVSAPPAPPIPRVALAVDAWGADAARVDARTSPREATCPHCLAGPMSLRSFDIHLRFECVALGRVS